MKARLLVFLDLYHGIAAIVLGILLLFSPDRSDGSLLNLMGLFWLTIGITVLVRGQDDERYPGKYTALVAGAVTAITGLLILTRRFTLQWMGEDVIFFVLGTVILATGLLHIFGEYKIGGVKTNRLTRIQFLLGMFEVLLGTILIFSPQLDTPLLYWTATAWAIVYGVLYLGTAVKEFLDHRQEKTDSEKKDSPTYE